MEVCLNEGAPTTSVSSLIYKLQYRSWFHKSDSLTFHLVGHILPWAKSTTYPGFHCSGELICWSWNLLGSPQCWRGGPPPRLPYRWEAQTGRGDFDRRRQSPPSFDPQVKGACGGYSFQRLHKPLLSLWFDSRRTLPPGGRHHHYLSTRFGMLSRSNSHQSSGPVWWRLQKELSPSFYHLNRPSWHWVQWSLHWHSWFRMICFKYASNRLIKMLRSSQRQNHTVRIKKIICLCIWSL